MDAISRASVLFRPVAMLVVTHLTGLGSGGRDITAPTITSSNTGTVAENATLAHALTANESVTWAIVGGADQARYEISGSTLRWASNGTKDFEAPDDADTNNAYVVTVRATDGAGNTTDQTITITVTDTAETVLWTQVASWTHSINVTTVDFTGLGGYSEFLVILRNVALTGAGSRRLRVSDDNGSTWVDGATDYQDIDNQGVEDDHDGPSLNSAIATTASDAALHIVGANLSAPPKMLERRTRTSFQACVSTPVGVINAIRIYATVGDFSAGTIRVYAR